MENNKKRLIIVDSNSIIHRAYHALPFFTTKKGEKVGAIYGFLLVFFKAIKDFQPDFVTACFDLPGLTFRHKKYKEYKAKRPPTPKEISQQIPKIKEILKIFNVPIFEKQGFEADDIIGTIARLVLEQQRFPEIETIILSSDSDMFQLVNPQTKVYALRKGVKDVILYDEKLVKEKFQGLKPKQLLDFKALRGDPSDNIPGVAGVGGKTATKLIKEFGTLENLYQKIEDPALTSGLQSRLSGGWARAGRDTKYPALEQAQRGAGKIQDSLKAKLSENKEQAFLSKMLVEIKTDAPIDFNLEKCRVLRDYNGEKVVKVLESFEFYSLIKKLSLFPIKLTSQNKLF